MPLASDVPPPAVELFLAQSAKAHGLTPNKSFPFQLRGTVAPFVMHVNTAPIDGPHGMGLPVAVTAERKGDEIAGSIAGLYVSAALVGTVTHGGERTHAPLGVSRWCVNRAPRLVGPQGRDNSAASQSGIRPVTGTALIKRNYPGCAG